MKVIGIDQASIISGYSIITNNKLKKYGIIDANEKVNDPYKRMHTIHEQFMALFKKEKPDYVAIEAVQMQGGNVHAFMILSNVQGVLISILYSLGIPFFIAEPSKWRAHNGIELYENGKRLKRPQLKKKACEMVVDRYGIQATEDESESVLIAQWLYDIITREERKEKQHAKKEKGSSN